MQKYYFHIGDYTKATAHLSNAEDLTYRRLIDLYYDTELPLEFDAKKLGRRVRCKETDVEQILKEFFYQTPEGWKHYRCDKELAEIYNKSAAAKASIEVRWNRKRNTDVIRTYNEGNTNAILPVTRNPEPVTQDPLPKNKDKIKSIAPKKFDPVEFLKSHGVSETVAEDWLVIRKTKKAPPTETSLSTIVREAEKAGLSMHDAITRCCQNSWAGFKASWPENTNGTQHMNVGDRRAETIAGLTGRNIKPKEQDHERDITGDCERIS